MRRGWIAMAIAAMAAPAGAVEYIPVYNFTLVGGQYFFTGDKTNLNANASLNVTPAMKFNERWTVIPTYSTQYRGTKSVLDSVGSASLFQQQMDHRVAVSGLYSVPDKPWKLKPTVSYKRSFLKETKDEEWGKGLFDYQTTGVGMAAEKVYKAPFSYRFGYDFYYIRYHNYQSLESQSGLDPTGNPLGREKAGTDVLDTLNHEVFFTVTRPFPYNTPKVSLAMTYRFRAQTYPDQPIIAQNGEPSETSPSHRKDFTQTLGMSVGYPRSFRGGAMRLGSTLNMSFSYNGSNQNTFDAGQTKFVADSYSYMSWTVGPQFSLSWGDEKNPVSVGTGISYTRTQYLGRTAQSSNGTYLDGVNQYQDRYLVSLSYGYPIAEDFRLTAQTNFLWARSNNNFEATYKYNYTTANYLMGFTYSY